MKATPKANLELAQKLFEDFYIECFWFWKRNHKVVQEDIPNIIKGLRIYGGHRGFKLSAKLCP